MHGKDRQGEERRIEKSYLKACSNNIVYKEISPFIYVIMLLA
jgi:hypothetical protein